MTESKVAGMWYFCNELERRGDCVYHSHHTRFNGVLYGLDESTEAIAEARQEKLIHDLRAENELFQAACSSEDEEAIVRVVEKYGGDTQKEIDHLTAELAKVKEQRDMLLILLKECMSKFREYQFDVDDLPPFSHRKFMKEVYAAIAACEDGGNK